MENKKVIDGAGDGYSWYGIGFKIGQGEEDRAQLDKERYIFGACAGAALYKKELFDKIGFFDEDFFAFYEDVDFNFRACLAGYKCLYQPKAVVYHQVGGTFQKKTGYFLVTRNSSLVILKNWPLTLILKYFPKILYAKFREFIHSIKIKRTHLFLLANLQVLFSLPKMLKKRRDIHKLRKVSNSYLEEIISKEYPY